MNQLPPFPVDDETLDMLMAAINPREHGDSEARGSTVHSFLELMSQLGGSDTKAVAEVLDEGDPNIPGITGAGVYVMRDQHYHENDVLTALVDEVRRLRAAAAFVPG